MLVDEEERLLLKRHACDKSSHTLAYLTLLDLCFPGAITPSFRLELNQMSPNYSMEQHLLAVEGSPYARMPSIHDYMEMNVAEIRTTIHRVLQREALASHCPARNMPRAARVLDSLIRSQLRYVAYTAVLIERGADAAEPDEFQVLFRKHARDFNRITSEEPIEYTYNQRFGNYP